jgi:hypothetical protein
MEGAEVVVCTRLTEGEIELIVGIQSFGVETFVSFGRGVGHVIAIDPSHFGAGFDC